MPQAAFAREDAGAGRAPTVAMAALPQEVRKRYVTQRGLKTYGWTDGCPACTEHSVGARSAVKARSDECRGRMVSEMERDDDLAAGHRVRRSGESEFPQGAELVPGREENVDMEDSEVPPASPATAASERGPWRTRRVAFSEDENVEVKDR